MIGVTVPVITITSEDNDTVEICATLLVSEGTERNVTVHLHTESDTAECKTQYRYLFYVDNELSIYSSK